MVRQTGVEPVTPLGSGFTVHRVCRFATDASIFDIPTAGFLTLLMAFHRASQTFPPHSSSEYLSSKHWIFIFNL